MSLFAKLRISLVLVTVAMAISTTSGCGGGDGGTTETDSKQVEITRNRQLWESKSLQSYSYTLTLQQFTANAGKAVRINVINGQAISVQPVDSRNTIIPEEFKSYNTVEKLFTLLANARSMPADSQTQSFDATYGLPTQAYIDYKKEIADEELGFSVTDFSNTPDPMPVD